MCDKTFMNPIGVVNKLQLMATAEITTSRKICKTNERFDKKPKNTKCRIKRSDRK